jgi:hypothetical protein
VASGFRPAITNIDLLACNDEVGEDFLGWELERPKINRCAATTAASLVRPADIFAARPPRKRTDRVYYTLSEGER